MKKIPLILFALLLAVSCEQKEKGGDYMFTLMSPDSTHVDFVNVLTETEHFNIIQYLYFNSGGGVAAGDINNDGLTDLFFISNQNSNKLYLNRGNLMFEEISKTAGVSGTGDWSTGVTMADVNGDGFLDIYVCQVGNYKGLQGKNQLFINQGNLTYKEKAAEYGLDFQGFSTQAAFFDYDMDGDLDMYLLNHSVHTSRSYGNTELRFDQDPRAGDRLYRNDRGKGGIVFHDVTHQAGIFNSQIGYGLGINISDINNDGYPDIYISNDFHENDYLYINNRNGTFSDRLTEMLAHTSRSSMGNDVGDMNNDGLLDIAVLDMLPDDEKIRKQSGGEDDYELFQMKLHYGYYNQFVRNTLQLNMGEARFSEIGRLSGIYSTDWSWSPLFCDLDNDGWKDLFITSGIYRRANDLDYINFLTGGKRFGPIKDMSQLPDKGLYEKMPLYPKTNTLFRNNGDLTFSDVSREYGFSHSNYSNGSLYADLDNDGDLDLAINNINSPASIYRNNSESLCHHHYLAIECKGPGFNTHGVGTRATLFCSELTMIAEQFTSRGFASSISNKLHFGLGSRTRIDSMIVRWPDLSEQRFYDIVPDQVLKLVYEPSSRPPFPSHRETHVRPFSTDSIPGLSFRHREDAYVDLTRERLIPHNLSAEGPPVAVGDLNGDGLEDLFLGGAYGQAAALFTQAGNGSFILKEEPLFIEDRIKEDVDAAFFDADGDGDLDLYIVHGGNMALTGDLILSDRLLINRGDGSFAECDPGSLPDNAYNGSCVCPEDMDGDGDVDLFVGSRSVPGAYGSAPKQILLENNGEGRFTDVTLTRFPQISNLGMVSDAHWTDYNLDGDPDLVLVGEWMNVCLLENKDGYFTDMTVKSGLEATSGWWNCIEVSDVDGDGDPDLLAGNLGLNSMLKASVEEPLIMYVNDFDNSGTLDQLICSYRNGTSYPIATLDEIAAQMSGIRQQYPNYSDFAGKTALELFGKDDLEQSLKREAVLLESCLFLNTGEGMFEKVILPKTVQFSTVRDIYAEDFDQDGLLDVILVGNNYSVRPSLGRYDASFGWFLKGKADAGFTSLWPSQSGLWIQGDARKVVPLKIKGKQFLVTTVNNSEIQLFRY